MPLLKAATMSDGGRRTALVTGCGKPNGLGAATARTLAGRGYAVMVSDVDLSGAVNAPERRAGETPPPEPTSQTTGGLETLVEELMEMSDGHGMTLGDISREDDVTRMVADANECLGQIDVLVNNAAAPHGPEHGDIVDVPVAAWDRLMEINVRGVFLMSRAVVPGMRERSWGRIINIASIAGRIGRPHKAAYSASKAAVIGFTRSLAIDLAAAGITVNAVCPGRMMTTRAISGIRRVSDGPLEEEIRKRAAMVPANRIADPREVAEVVAFLSSDECSYLTGQAMNVDGGEYPL